MSNEQKHDLHINRDSDQKVLELLLNLSEKLEEENVLNITTKSVYQPTNLLSCWELSKSPYHVLKKISKRHSKVSNEDMLTDSAKKRIKRCRENEKIDLALDPTACVKQESCDFCSETGFYMKYKSLVRSLASQKWRAWTAGVTQVTREQLRARMSGSAKTGSLNENLQKLNKLTTSSENVSRENTKDDYIYPSKVHYNTLPFNSETTLHRYQPLQKRFPSDQATLRDRKLAMRNQKIYPQNDIRRCVNLCAYKCARGMEQSARDVASNKNRPSIPTKNLTPPHSFDCSGKSFTVSPIFPPILGQKTKKTMNN